MSTPALKIDDAKVDRYIQKHRARQQLVASEHAAEQAWKASERKAAERRHVDLCNSWISWHQEQKARAERTHAAAMAHHDAEIQRYKDLLSKTSTLEAPH